MRGERYGLKMIEGLSKVGHHTGERIPYHNSDSFRHTTKVRAMKYCCRRPGVVAYAGETIENYLGVSDCAERPIRCLPRRDECDPRNCGHPTSDCHHCLPRLSWMSNIQLQFIFAEGIGKDNGCRPIKVPSGMWLEFCAGRSPAT